MSGDFKQQLKAYREGKLSQEEREELEAELAKMELYQSHLDELLEEEQRDTISEVGSMQLNPKRAKELMRRGKWRARSWSIGGVIGIVLAAMIVNSILTSIYYGLGKPEKRNLYADVIESAIAVTSPNMRISLNSNPASVLGIKYFGDLVKQVGDERVYMGDLNTTMFLGWPRLIDQNDNKNSSNRYTPFYLPDESYEENGTPGSSKLSSLPEGTVAEVYVSFDRMYSTDEALKLFEGKDMEPVWLAVYTGEAGEEGTAAVRHPVGFPTMPMWHEEDGYTTVYEERKVLWWTVGSGSTTSYPGVETYGSGDVRNENFVNTLRLLSKNKTITNYYTHFFDADQVLDYVEENGVTIYGMVVTGPTKELLKLKDAPFVRYLHVGEARLWNWDER
ncbi:anti sigma factor C-terminal domain-containing protein [Paenibacillus sp. 2TAB19]|uniref:anti-sigma factor n=1 Tax=Paenibacillus sp. 2TAB19 TaxID=3233003 RepID=UPI003F9BCC09